MWGERYRGDRYWGARFWGKHGFTAPGYFRGGRYWGPHYWARRYFASQADNNPFALAQTAGVGLNAVVLPAAPTGLLYTATFNLVQTANVALFGALTVGGALVYENDEFVLTPPLDGPALNAVLGVTGNLTFSAPAPGVGRHWGPRYWGPKYWALRYWGTRGNFNFAQTANLALTGGITTAGGIATEIGVVPTNVLAFSAVLGVAGDVTAGATAATGHGFEMMGSGPRRPKRRGLVYVDQPEVSTAESRDKEQTKPAQQAKPAAAGIDREAAKAQALALIEAAAKEHAETLATEPVRFAAVRAALKPLQAALGDWNWVSVYQRLYDKAINEQLKTELDVSDQLAEEEALSTILMLS